MAKTNMTNINIRTDKDIKAAAERIYEELGLNLSTAVNIFLHQTIRENGIPFELKLDVPNQTTATAMDKGRGLAYDRSAIGYSDLDNLKDALDI